MSAYRQSVSLKSQSATMFAGKLQAEKRAIPKASLSNAQCLPQRHKNSHEFPIDPALSF
jgi:hypothetical protein